MRLEEGGSNPRQVGRICGISAQVISAEEVTQLSSWVMLSGYTTISAFPLLQLFFQLSLLTVKPFVDKN
jgi:hypothetical protein